MEAHRLIHPSADVSVDASIGEGTRIWDLARVRERAVIGRDCIIGRGAYVDAGVHVGDRVKIQNNALVYHGVSVGSDVFIGPAAILTNDRFPRSVTVDGALAGAEDWLVSEIDLADGCSIGAGAIVVAGCDVGRYALVGAGSVVTRSVPDHAVVVGCPARVIGWACDCGRRLVNDSAVQASPDHEGEARCPEHRLPYIIRDGRCAKAVPA